MKKIMVIFGTRPEAIKLVPVIRELRSQGDLFETVVCVTAQHRQMLDQVLAMFEIVPDYDLNVMTNDQDLFDISTKCLHGLKDVLSQARPDLVLVQGDTTTTFIASLAAFYLRTEIGHVEAGLRTHNKYQPFPEEKNRHMTSTLADYHFAPTQLSKQSLIAENIPADRVWVTGNTSIDALLSVVEEQRRPEKRAVLNQYFRSRWNLPFVTSDREFVLVTGHRRENFGEGFRHICTALKEIASSNPDFDIVYPVHLNPNVRRPVYEILGDGEAGPRKYGNIYLIEPLDYEPFVYLMSRSYVILTDSGGIQEEAPSLGKPVLVMRNTTERPEGVSTGNTMLVGTDRFKIIRETQRLLDDRTAYEDMASKRNPYGDGKAAKRIAAVISGRELPRWETFPAHERQVMTGRAFIEPALHSLTQSVS